MSRDTIFGYSREAIFGLDMEHASATWGKHKRTWIGLSHNAMDDVRSGRRSTELNRECEGLDLPGPSCRRVSRPGRLARTDSS